MSRKEELLHFGWLLPPSLPCLGLKVTANFPLENGCFDKTVLQLILHMCYSTDSLLEPTMTVAIESTGKGLYHYKALHIF